MKKYDFSPVEYAVADEKAREMQKIQKQKDHIEENSQPQLRINGKKKVAISFLSTKVKKVDEVEVVDEKHEDKAGILEDFEYHDNINAENYEKYFENACKLLKPNSVIIIDKASYHSRNADDSLFQNGKVSVSRLVKRS